MYYKNKVVWITGSSSGTGEAIAYELNKQGAKLIISARREAELERVKNNCENKENPVYILPLDLEKHDELTQKSIEAWNIYGKIDIVFHNGGISQRSPVIDTIFDVDKRIMNINYFGSVIITKALLPKMIKEKKGHFVVMSSLSGLFGIPLRSAYAASKHALHGFYDSLRAELHSEGIKVTLICSGYIKTNIANNALTDKGEKFATTDPEIENGMSTEYFVKKALKAVKNGKKSLLLGGKEKIGAYLKRFAPELLAKILRNR